MTAPTSRRRIDRAQTPPRDRLNAVDPLRGLDGRQNPRPEPHRRARRINRNIHSIDRNIGGKQSRSYSETYAFEACGNCKLDVRDNQFAIVSFLVAIRCLRRFAKSCFTPLGVVTLVEFGLPGIWRR